MNNWIFDPIATANGAPAAYFINGDTVLIAMFDRTGNVTIATTPTVDFSELYPLDSVMQTAYQAGFTTQRDALQWFNAIKDSANVIAAAYATGKRRDDLHTGAVIRIVVDNWNAVLVLNVHVLNASGQTIQVKSGYGRKAFIRRDNMRKENGYYLVKDDGSFTFRSLVADGLCYSTISEAIR